MDCLRLRLVGCKIFSKCKIFSGVKYFQERKIFSSFGCIMKIVLENVFMCLVAFWKCYFPVVSHIFSPIFSATKQNRSQYTKPFGQTERGRRKREWSQIEGKGEVDRERERSVIGGSWVTRPVQRGQASGEAKIETKRVWSRGRRDDLTVRSRRDDLPNAISMTRSCD